MERLVTRKLIDTIASFDGGGSPVTSIYLGLEKGETWSKREAATRLKDLVASGREAIMAGRSHAEKRAIEADIEKAVDFVSKADKIDVEGLAIYSCSPKNYFETIGIRAPFRPLIFVSDRPEAAHLFSALDEFKRICVCLVDRRSARVYEYFMGRMEEVKSIESADAMPRVRVAGVNSYDESKIRRDAIHHEREHLKRVADYLLVEFRLRGFDWLFLGARAHEDTREAFIGALHTYVRDRLKGRLEISLDDRPGFARDVREKAHELAERLKREEIAERLGLVIQMRSAGGPAVAGLKDALNAINMGAVSTLFVRHGASVRGAVCEGCGFVAAEPEACAVCGGGAKAVDNVILAAEEAALARGAIIRHVYGPSPLDDFDGIGAFVRFKVPSAPPVTAGA